MSTEYGFYHPVSGYWQAIAEPSEDLLASYPEGTVPYPLKPGENYKMQDGGWVPVEPETTPLPVVKTRLKLEVDRAAEAERRKYITPGSGQAMTYMQKADEAARYLAATDPLASDYPLLSAEVGITAETLAEVAQIVQGAFSQWQVIGAAIEAARLAAKAAIDGAENAQDAQAAADAVVWP